LGGIVRLVITCELGLRCSAAHTCWRQGFTSRDGVDGCLRGNAPEPCKPLRGLISGRASPSGTESRGCSGPRTNAEASAFPMPVPRHAPWISPDASDNKLSRFLAAWTGRAHPLRRPPVRCRVCRDRKPSIRFNTLADFSDDRVRGQPLPRNRLGEIHDGLGFFIPDAKRPEGSDWSLDGDPENR
jgi:hypothetical protein